MDSTNPPIPTTTNNNTTYETDEETEALRKKRSRRVSFADREITSVHIFNRDDDDSESAPRAISVGSSSSSPSHDNKTEKENDNHHGENEVLGFFKDLADSDDDDDVVFGIGDVRKSFWRPIESPSPGGSSILGSATSNDEDNFFGPVSASFIRPGRLSDWGASDDHHELTMDSTAFSMHYRSLARSESGGELRTPTKDSVASVENTPCEFVTPADSHSSMVLTEAKKLNPQDQMAREEVSGGGDSMSLVGTSLHRYDTYGELSPALKALLAEGSKDQPTAAVFDPTDPTLLKSGDESKLYENGDVMNQNNSEAEMVDDSMQYVSAKEVPADLMNLDVLESVFVAIHTDDILNGNENGAANVSLVDSSQNTDELRRVENDRLGSVLEVASLDAEFPATTVGGGTPKRMDPKVVPSFSFGNDESGQHQREESLRDFSPQFSNKSSNQQSEFPIVGSISSLAAKRKKIFVGADNSGRQLVLVTPSPKQPGSFATKFNIGSVDIASSLRKSNSNLRDGIEQSKKRLLEFNSPAPSPFNNTLGRNSVSVCGINMNAATAVLDTCTEENKRYPQENNMNGGRVGMQTPLSDLSITQETETVARDGIVETPSPIHNLSIKSPAKLKVVVSPSVSIQSKDKDMQHILIPEKPKEMSLLVTGSESILLGTKMDRQNHSTTSKAPDTHVFSTSLSNEFNHGVKYDGPADISSGSDQSSTDTLSKSLTAMTSNLESLIRHSSTQSSLTLPETGHGNLTRVENLDKGQSPIHHLHAHEMPINVQTSLGKNYMDFDSGIPHKNNPTAPNIVHLDRKVNETSPSVSLHDHIEKVNESFTKKSPLKDASNVVNGQQLVGTGMLLPGIMKHVGHKSRSPSSLEKCGRRKRKIEQSIVGKIDLMHEISKIRKSTDIHGDHGSDLALTVDNPDGSENQGEIMAPERRLKNWRDVSLTLSTQTDQLLPPLIDKLHMSAIDVLQDILLQLQKSKKYEMLCAQFMVKKTGDLSGKVEHERMAEMKLLLYKLAYEKARLQLMSIKHQRMTKRAEQLSGAVQESKVLKSNSIQSPSIPKRDYNFQTSSSVSTEKLVTMKHELEALGRKVINLTKSLHSYCKVQGEPSPADSILLLNDFLKKRASCRFICEDFQPWELDDMQSTNDERHIFLSYKEFIRQRVTIKYASARMVSISNELSHVNITKNFPNMGAPKVFGCVLNAETTKKYVGSRNLAQETQVTSLILSNLLDVLEEVQLARIEIKNLTETNFCSSDAEQLDLQLCFIDFKSCKKLILTLDMSCLKSGVYPLEIYPYRLESSNAGTRGPLSDSLSTEIKSALDSLEVGHTRILRLCRRVSQVFQNSN